MSRASTTLNLLLAAMFLVSMVPATTAATDPATDEQEAAIEDAQGIDVPSSLPWTVRNELHQLFLNGNALSYSRQGGDAATARQLTPVTGPPTVGVGTVTPAPAPVFTLGSPTVAETEITSFSANLRLTSTTSATVTVELLNITGTTTTVVDTLTITVGGVLISAPSPVPVGTVTEYSASKLTSKVIPPGGTLAVRISASSPGVVTLYHGGSANPDSRIGLTADSSRVKAWTEKDGTPGVVQSNFASPANAPSEERTLRFILAHVQAFGQGSQVAQPVVFQILAPNGAVVFDSSGSPVGVTAANDQRWGSADPLPADDKLPDVDGVVARVYKLTYPNTLTQGAYQVHLCIKTCGASAPSVPFDLPVNIGASGGAFELASNPAEAAEKTVLVGQRTTFRLTLRNTGGVEDTYALQATVGSLVPGWTATISPAQVKLGPGATTDVVLTVIPSANGANGQSNTVTATATSLLSGSSFTLPQTLRVLLTNVRTTGVEILNATNATASNPEPILRATVAPGGQVAIPAFVQNLGNGFDRVVVSLSGAPAGWTVSANPALLELGARSQGASVIRIESPANVAPSTSFLLTMKASRLDNLTQSDTQVFRVVVSEIDAFVFEAADDPTSAEPSGLFDQSSVTAPIVHWLRDEGPDSDQSNDAGRDKWDGTPDGDKDFDESALFRLVLTNTGSRPDTYQLTPYVLTHGGSTSATLAGGAANVEKFGFSDKVNCDGSASDKNDGKNDGWVMRMYRPGEAPDFATVSQSFADVLTGQDLSVAVPAKGSAIVYVEMKWYAPAGTGCGASTHQVADAASGPTAVGSSADTPRATDPAPGHAILVEAVSTTDASHRATHILNARLGPSGDRTASQNYANTINGGALWLEAGEPGTKKVTTDAGARTATYKLRGFNTGNETDRVTFEIPHLFCPSGSAVSSCWENGIAATLDLTGASPTGKRPEAGSCTTPAIVNPGDLWSFTCTLGVFDEVGFQVTTTAPSAGEIGQSAKQKVTMRTSRGIADTIELVTAITGQYALDIITGPLSGGAPVHAGETTAIPFTVRNLGTNEDNVTVDLRDSLPTGWTGDFSVPNPVFVPPGRSVDLLLFAKAPAGAAVDTLQKFEVRVTSGDSPAIVRPTDNITLVAQVKAKSALLNLTAEPSNLLATPGEEVVSTVKATRNGGSATTARFQVDPTSVPPGWTATLQGAGTGGVLAVAYTEGVATATLRITPNEDAIGTSRAAIRALADQSATGTFNPQEFTLVGVSLSTPNLGVDLVSVDGDTILVAPGSATTVHLTAENLGVTQDVIGLSTGQLPAGWSAVFEAENITLQPLQKRTIDVTVTAPSDLTAGQSRLLTFIGTTADGLRSDILQLNFTTGSSILGLTANVIGTRNLLPLEPSTFTVTVNNTGDLPDDIVMRAAGSFSNIASVNFDPASFALEPGQAREVTVRVTPTAGLAPRLDVPLVIEAASKGPFLKSVGTVTVQGKILDHKVRDIDGDKTEEYAIDRDVNAANGFEDFRDPSVGGGISKSIDPASFLSAEAKGRLPNFVFDPDGDKRTDLLIDLDADGKPDVFWDPDLGFSHVIPLLKDVTKDGREDYFFDTVDQDGRLDVFYDPIQGTTGRLLKIDIDNNGVLDYVVDTNGNSDFDASETVLFNGPDGSLTSIREFANVDGKRAKNAPENDDAVIDTDADGKPDYFIPDGTTAAIPIVLEDVNGDGIEDWTFDSDGDGRRDSYFDPASRESHLIDPQGGFMDQLAKYWYIGALFGVVLVLFVVLLLVTRR